MKEVFLDITAELLLAPMRCLDVWQNDYVDENYHFPDFFVDSLVKFVVIVGLFGGFD